MIVEQSNFEQFTPTPWKYIFQKKNDFCTSFGDAKKDSDPPEKCIITKEASYALK